MDLLLDDEAFNQGSKALQDKSIELQALRTNIENSFEQLKQDWDSEAGRKFFTRFELDLIKNLDNYAKVFGHMSKNLSGAANAYSEVYSAADTVAQAQF